MQQPRPQLPRPALVLVTDSKRLRPERAEGIVALDDLVREAVLGGVNVVQLREKDLATADLIELGLHVRDAIAGRALFFVNGDIRAALALGADGLQLPEEGASISQVRANCGDKVLVSRAVHSVAGAVTAEREGADLVQLGTVFETSSKPGAAVLGLDGVRTVCAAVTVPVISIGGITAANAPHVLEAGAAGVAVIGAIFAAADPRSAAERIAASLHTPSKAAR